MLEDFERVLEERRFDRPETTIDEVADLLQRTGIINGYYREYGERIRAIIEKS